MLESIENRFGHVKSFLHYAHQTCEIYQLLTHSMDFKAHRELWNPLSKTVLSFVSNKGPVNILKDSKI